MTTSAATTADALVVGGGPAGFAAATELARRDRRVVVVDRGEVTDDVTRVFTPRAVAASRRLGIDLLDHFHPIERIRLTASVADHPGGAVGPSTSSEWPRDRATPDSGCVGTRRAFVERLRSLADELGVEVLDGHDAIGPIVDRGFVRGASVRRPDGHVHDVRAAFTVVADGANSNFGRHLGTYREPDWPLAMAHAADYHSPLHLANEIELVVGVTDRAGTPIAGYGWMYPTGDETIGVGVMLFSTSPSFAVINPAHLLERFAEQHASRWQLGERPVTPPIGGRIPLGMSVGPLAGPTYLIIGDAGGVANPLSGLGIDTALETGIIAGDVVGEALDHDSPAVLQHYPKLVDERYGSYYKIGRLTDRLVGQPPLARRLHAALGARPAFAEGALRVGLQHLRSGRAGFPELVYGTARAVASFAPEA